MWVFGFVGFVVFERDLHPFFESSFVSPLWQVVKAPSNPVSSQAERGMWHKAVILLISFKFIRLCLFKALPGM